ncbi:MAG: hypothetical protein PHP23_15285, partial [Desulfobacterales bacterium]|nr:hypothetical protein [Desulfobacterales bacterium]MDD4070974.1 hypothetical protein [Desulfobacterales bacterium]MDD4394028.1 hypothetical protein [Desulfobacterales bacterium]
MHSKGFQYREAKLIVDLKRNGGNYSAKKQKVAKKRLDRVFLKNFKIQLDMTLLSYSDNNESDR